MTADGTSLASLRGAHAGRTVLPGDADWDVARQPWNQSVELRPAAVVYPESVDDVIRIVAFAGENGLTVAPQGLGHGSHTLGPLDDAVLLRTVKLAGVEIDAAARRARVEAGVPWERVAEPAGEVGLAGLAGTAPDINVVGYTVGGGLGWLGRLHGFACNSVRWLDVVTADGRLVRADAESEPDLFWALRGGGGSFGVVTALELELHPVGEVYAGVGFWPGERARDVLRLYRDWVADIPERLTSQARFLNVPAVPFVPEALHDRFVVGIEACYAGSASEGEALVRPLAELGPPLLWTFAPMPAARLGEIHGDPPVPAPGMGHHALLRELSDGAVDALITRCGPDSGTPLVSVELRHLGGALARNEPGHGALDRLDAEFAVFALGLPFSPADHAPLRAHLTEVIDGLKPWSTERGYLNFAEQPVDAATLFPPDTYRRLTEVRRAYDPGSLFRANHRIACAS